MSSSTSTIRRKRTSPITMSTNPEAARYLCRSAVAGHKHGPMQRFLQGGFNLKNPDWSSKSMVTSLVCRFVLKSCRSAVSSLG